jgi:hypothetical protein
MFKNTARLLLIVGLASSLSLPTYARGFGGGGFHGFGGGGFHGLGGDGHGFGGAGRELGGAGHGFSGSGMQYGGAGHGFSGSAQELGGAGHGFSGMAKENTGGFGGSESHPNYGGGFNSASGGHGVVSNHPNYAGGGEGYGHQGQYANHSQFPTDGGFGNATGERVPQNFDKNNFSGNNINKGNFNNDTFNKNVNYNNVNAYGNHSNYGAYGGYHANGAYGYHPYGGYGGYHPYGGYGGYHPYGGYGYGYNPEAMMWTYAGISSLTTLTGFLGMSALMGASKGGSNQQPASYSNVTYNGGNVYIDGQPQGSSEEFYKQAQQLAATSYNTPYTTNAPAVATAVSYPGMPAAAGVAAGVPIGQYPGAPATGVPAAAAASADWKPLGTFSLAEPGQKQSNMMLQLDINPEGMLHGTYYNQLTMETSQVYGALDKAKQRVSWTIGTNPSTVFDAGLGDLVKNESSVLVHYSPSNTQRMDLIRMEHPPEGANGQPPPGAPGQMPPGQPG